MKQVYLLYDFNPYHNRQIKKFDTVADYLSAASSYEVSANDKNFKYADGVNTIMPIRTSSDTIHTPDYILVVVPTTQVIESRWFVLEADLKTARNYDLVLHRDVVADNYEDIIDAPAFIEKATLNDDDPFIFNQEQITVNQIKQDETLLQDESKCAWIVGYLATDAVTSSTTVSGGATRVADYEYSTEANFISQSGIAAASMFTTVESGSSLPTTIATPRTRATKYRINIAYYNDARSVKHRVITARWSSGESIATTSNEAGYSADEFSAAYPNIVTAAWQKSTIWANVFANTVCNNINTYRNSMASQIDGYGAQSFTNTLSTYHNKIWLIGDKYYRSKVVNQGSSYYLENNTLSAEYDSGTAIISAVNEQSWDTTYVGLDGISIGYDMQRYGLEFTEITAGTTTFTLTGNEIALNHIPYKMFAIPYSKDHEITFVNQNKTIAGDYGITVANALSDKYSGAGSLYDIQLLPYCPIRDVINDEYSLLTPSSITRYTTVTTEDVFGGHIYWCESNTFSFDIAHAISVDNVKLDSITEMYRISSPNWNGQFEFNPAKNGGVSSFNVDCTYKPFTPYIHINPDFGRLYGQDFDDARGLICAGDFSLPQINDQWQTYELQNKNYQNEFNRQIQNIELTQDINMKKQLVGATVGAIQGAVTGGMTGSLVGGIPGAVAGAAVGGLASSAGAIADYQFQKILNEEVIDYSRDQFAMRNENIQALPDSLKQVGAYTANNKIFPVLEHYSCTEQEKEAVELKLYYNGMRVERVGTIRDFLKTEETYIKAKLIRLNIAEDNHYIEAIATELNKGVFIK